MFSGRPTGIQRVVLAQAGFAPVAALAGLAVGGSATAGAALYGAITALAVSGVMVWRERQALRHPEWDQHRLFKLFIRTGVERLAVLVGLLGLGLGGLTLLPLPLMTGLILAQFGWLAAAVTPTRH
jgi:ATP synthase protein I